MRINNDNRALVLAALYNNAKTQGMARLAYKPGHVMDDKEASDLLKKQTYFDYLYGRVMKVDLSKDNVDFYLYDRDNGQGAGFKACRGLEV